jgi:antirestriction protein
MTSVQSPIAHSPADMDVPAIYIANLRAYNEGSLAGAWINPSSDVNDLREQILQAIGGNAENEWAIHDYSDFPCLGEHASLEDISKVAEMLEEHDPDAVRAAIDNCGVRYLEQANSILENGWRQFDKVEDIALEELAQDLAEEGQLDKEFLLRYVDWERVGRELSHGYIVVERNGKTFVFNH